MTIAPELKSELMRVAERQAAAAVAAPARRRLRWPRRRAAPLVVIAVLCSSGIAVGGGFVVSKQTEQKSARLADQPAPTSGPVSKLGDQMVETAAQIAAELPYPPGMPDTYDWSKYSRGATLGTGGEARREIQGMSEFRAACLWRRYYLRTHDTGDPQGMRAAARILIQSHSWTATRRLTGKQPSRQRPFAAFDAAAAQGEVAPNGRREVEINCFDHTKAELMGKAPLVRHPRGY